MYLFYYYYFLIFLIFFKFYIFFIFFFEYYVYMAQLGFRTLQEMVGRVDLLRPVTHTDIAKADTNYNIMSNLMHLDKRKTIDLTDLLTPAWVSSHHFSFLIFPPFLFLLMLDEQLRGDVATSCTVSKINHDEEIGISLDLRIMREASSLFPTTTDTKDDEYVSSLLYSSTPGDSTKSIKLDLPINNTNRTVGALLSYAIANRYGFFFFFYI
jgi:hypothetical protein